MRTRKFILSGIAITVCLPIPLAMLYNYVGNRAVEQSEQCWIREAPRGKTEYATFELIAKRCGLTERGDGVKMYPDGLRRTYYSKEFIDYGFISGWHREYGVQVVFPDTTEMVEVTGSRNDGLAWLIVP